jgi:hypothetical protein
LPKCEQAERNLGLDPTRAKESIEAACHTRNPDNLHDATILATPSPEKKKSGDADVEAESGAALDA